MKSADERRLAMRLMLGDAAIDAIVHRYANMARMYADSFHFEKKLKIK